ncbi:MFS transporter [Streptomyces cupreus]|uniref:MFS transporter n=1 Tax=Streptomyces cupreus TaxID=2759956 RepID=UPI0021B33966|nr:MFS transporter [Streptomyces cupreus]
MPATETASGHRLRITLLIAGSCLPILGAVLIAPVLPKMRDHFADVPGADALVPMALTVPALSLALLAPFAGVVVDRLGRKRLLVIATVLYAFLGTAPLWLDSLGAIVASRALVGVVEAAIMTCCTTLIGDYYAGRQRDRYLALQTMCASISATAFFVLGGAAGAAGWRAPFWAYAVTLLLAPAMAAFLPQPRSTGKVSSPEAERRPFPWRPLAGTCALTVFGAVLFYTVQVEMAFLLDDMGVEDSGTIGLAIAASSAATVLGAGVFTKTGLGPESLCHLPGRISARRLVRAIARRRSALDGGAPARVGEAGSSVGEEPRGRFGNAAGGPPSGGVRARRRAPGRGGDTGSEAWLPGVFALCGLGFAVIWLASDPVVLTLGAVISCFGGGIMLPSLLTLAMSRLDYADRGRGTGLWTGSFFIGQFICPLVVLALTAAVGTLADAMGVLAAAGALGAAGLGLSARRRRPVAAPEPVSGRP